ncbi:MAG: DUF3179 domain-containing (seleno)protein [Alphaproteobacteria bacterium]
MRPYLRSALGKARSLAAFAAFAALTTAVTLALWTPPGHAQSIMEWAREFPKTDFSRTEIPFDEIVFDGARRDSIPPIHDPVFAPAAEITDMGDLEPVISVAFAGVARAYPLRMMLWHEIVNDRIGDLPFLVTYCPLCNSGLVFDRRLDERELRFGNTGRIRHFDMVMYDHETESWWQQFGGSGLIGELAGRKLKLLPARLESLATFRARSPDGVVLVPADPTLRRYGQSPYAGMEGRTPSGARFPYDLPGGVRMFDYVVVVGDRAWPLDRVVAAGRIEEAGLILQVTGERNSLHDQPVIARARTISDVHVARVDAPDVLVPHDVTFAFAFAAFVSEGEWQLGTAE